MKISNQILIGLFTLLLGISFVLIYSKSVFDDLAMYLIQNQFKKVRSKNL